MPVTPVIKPATHPAVRAKLPRTSKKASIPVPTPTPSRRTTKQRRQRRHALQAAILDITLVTPLIGRVPSLYHQPLPSSLYIFNHDFYNNKDIINGDISFEDTVFGTETNRQAKHLHKVHKSIIQNSQLNDEFKPIDIPNPPRPLRARLSNDCDIKRPETFFLIFIGDK
jgi:hypothetical protein